MRARIAGKAVHGQISSLYTKSWEQEPIEGRRRHASGYILRNRKPLYFGRSSAAAKSISVIVRR